MEIYTDDDANGGTLYLSAVIPSGVARIRVSDEWSLKDICRVKNITGKYLRTSLSYIQAASRKKSFYRCDGEGKGMNRGAVKDRCTTNCVHMRGESKVFTSKSHFYGTCGCNTSSKLEIIGVYISTLITMNVTVCKVRYIYQFQGKFTESRQRITSTERALSECTFVRYSMRSRWRVCCCFCCVSMMFRPAHLAQAAKLQ
jgi:hypothetical protein